MPIDNRLIAVAVAHDLTPGMLATWDPRLARTPRVLVPVQLDVLMVRADGGTWAKTAMAVPDAGTSPDAYTLLAEPFAERDPRKPGAYLHWALPDALTRGEGTAAGGDVSFPPIPDRWLVARISTPTVGARRAVTAWVLEADGADPVVTPLEQWAEPSDPERTTTAGAEPLTALGHGDAVWSAYYDNVENRLAFYDDLAGATGPVAYLVCGWHSRHVDDPIGEGLSSPTQFEARLAELGWEVDPADIEAAFVYAQQRISVATTFGMATRETTFAQSATAVTGKTLAPTGVAGQASTTFAAGGLPVLGRWAAQTVSWPELTLYHGAVVGLGWPGVGIGVAPDGLLGGDAGGPPDPSTVTVTVGNTLTEALATMLAHNEGADDEARVLEAVLLGATEELDQPDAPARIDVRLHASGFAGLPGGTTTENLTQTSPLPPTSVVADPSATDPGVFAGNGVPTPTATPTPTPTPTKATATTPTAGATVLGQLVATVQDSPRARISPTFATGTFDTVLQVSAQATANVTVRVPHAPNADPPAETVTAERALPRFFVPADPVFLLEGAGRSFKHGFDGIHAESGLLVCRLSGHTVTGVSPSRLVALPGGTVRGEDLLQGGLDHGGVPVECEDLLRELAVLDPGSAETAAMTRIRLTPAGQAAAPLEAVAQVYAVEQTAWWNNLIAYAVAAVNDWTSSGD